MPRAKEYATNAERQAAYRKRCLQAKNSQPLSKEPSSLRPAISMPGRRKWKSILSQANYLIQCVASETEAYYEQRSEKWQDSDKGEEFVELLESIQTALSALEDIAW